jgi:hypothetical protein
MKFGVLVNRESGADKELHSKRKSCRFNEVVISLPEDE